MLQPKATGWLLHQQRAPACHLEGGEAPARASWTTHLPFFKVGSLWEKQDGPWSSPLPESPVGMTPEAFVRAGLCPRPTEGAGRTLEYTRAGLLALALTCCGQAGLSDLNSFLLWLLVPWGCVGWQE